MIKSSILRVILGGGSTIMTYPLTMVHINIIPLGAYTTSLQKSTFQSCKHYNI